MEKLRLAYAVLRGSAQVGGVAVWDTHHDGPGVTMWRKSRKKYKPAKYVIVVGYYKSLKKRLFVLAHEIGHCMIMKETRDGHLYLAPRKRPVGEEGANKTAMAVLKEFGEDLPSEFAKFYNWANRHSKRRKPL